MPDEPSTLQLATMPPEIKSAWGEHGRRLRFLWRVGLFRDLSQEHLIAVAMALKSRSVVAGAIVCREGEPADQFYLIEAGTLVVSTEIAGQAHELARLGPGQSVGEVALLGEGRRTATVRAETPARLWALSDTDFHELLQRAPGLDAAIRSVAQARNAASLQSVFEVENRNLAALAEGRQQIRIGRSADNDLVFSSRLVSKHHAVLERSGDGYRLRDLDSANGTYVDGAHIQSVQLTDGAEIRVGDERFIFDHRALRRWSEPRGMRVDIADVGREVAGGKKLLDGISLSILPGEFVAIVGGSGAGKTTLLDAISGVRPATSGRVLYNGRDYYQNLVLYRPSLGYVPQDDIIHRDLPVRRTLWFAGKLRLPPDTSDDELGAAIDEALRGLNLSSQADLQVASLSGGQRKRTSIGVELLTQPRIFFLDEPTSGLDPATDAQMMRLLRRLADAGSTVILTTHATKNVALCDKIVFLARGGQLAFAGTPRRALQYFEVEAFDEIYERLAGELTPEEWAARFRASEDYAQVVADQPAPAEAVTPAAAAVRRHPFELLRQWAVLTHRNLDILLKNPANLVPLFVTPAVITLLLVALYRSGSFSIDVPNPSTPAQVLFFLAFSAFFFGLSYGAHEICKEFAIFFRERLVNLAIVPYVLSKVAILLPILVMVMLFMLGVLRLTGRLPDRGLDVYGPLALTLVLTAFAGLALGLAASAAVKVPEQASIVLPGLILPQVLFSGVLLPVPSMAVVGRLLSDVMAIRWAFEALGKTVDLNGLFSRAASPLGRPLLQQYGDSFSHATSTNWGILVAMTLLFLVLTCGVLARKSRTG